MVYILKPNNVYIHFETQIFEFCIWYRLFFFFNTIVGRTFFDTFDISYYGDFKWKMKSPSR